MNSLETIGWIAIKGASIVLILIYVVFAGVMVKQVGVITKTLTLELGKFIKIATWFHLAMVILILVIAIFIL